MEQPASLDHLQALAEWLSVEKKADFEYYRYKILNTTLREQREKGVCWFPVSVTDAEVGLGAKASVRLVKQNDSGKRHNFRVGQIVSFFSANQQGKPDHMLSGVISHLGDDEMRVALQVERLPEWVSDGKLGVHLGFDDTSYREMFIALGKLKNSEDSRLLSLRELLIGRLRPRFRPESPLELPQLNASQNEALRHVLAAEDVALIHGPPGTGKTTTLVQCIKQTLKSEKQLLVCAPSNTAVDLLAERLHAQGIRVLRIGHPARVNAHLEELTLDNKLSEQPEYKDFRQLLKKADACYRMAGKYKRNFGRREREQRKALREEGRALKQEALKLEDYLVHRITEDVQVICATLVGASHPTIRHKTFSTAFIDEAGQALEPALFIPLSRAKRLVLAGDHQQLPPTIKTSDKAAQAGLSYTLFEKLIQEKSNTSRILKTQYRMHKDIMAFSNREFYEGQLLAHESVAERKLFPEDYPLQFIDTGGTGFEEAKDPDNLSTFNREEARLLLRHLHETLGQVAEKLNGQDRLDELSVGVITPYKAQVQQLESLVREDEQLYALVQQGRLSIKTVDGFQGQEKDIIYLSLVRSNNEGEIGFLKDYRRFNVALTRAKYKLVVFGDSPTLSNDTVYQRFMDEMEKLPEAWHSAWEWIEG